MRLVPDDRDRAAGILRAQPPPAAPHLPAPIIREGTPRVVLSGARELLLLLGDGVTNNEYLHANLLCDGSVG
jgi:hypothetical protein